MKRLSSIALLGAFLALGVTACDDDMGPEPGVKSISVTPQDASVQVGGTANFSASVETAGGASSDVSWSSGDPSVASVDQNGVATGESEGSTTVTATSTADPTKKASANITVTAPEPAQLSITGYRAASTVNDNSLASPDTVGTETAGSEESFTILEVDAQVDPGSKEVAKVELLLNGEVADSRTISSSSKVAGATAIDYNLRVNTQTFDPNDYVGDVITPDWPNGAYQIGLRATFTDGSTKELQGPTTNFVNEQQLFWSVVEEPNTVIDDSDERWFGGTSGTYALTVVDHFGVGVGSVDIEDDNGTYVFQNGSSQITLNSAPFQVIVDAGDNAGAAGEIELELDGPKGSGDEAIRDSDGEEYDLSGGVSGVPFQLTTLSPFQGVPSGTQEIEDAELNLDYCGPTVDSDDVTVLTPDGTEWSIMDQFFKAGVFNVGTSTTRCGAEADIASDTEAFDWQIDVEDTGSGDVHEDVMEIGDLGERTNTGYVAEIIEISDALGNPGSVTDVGQSDDFGVDRSPLEITNVAPADQIILNPDNDNGDGDDQDLEFTAVDAVLEDGNPGSGYGTTSTAAEHADGTTASPAVSPDASGDNEIETGGLQDGFWTLVATHEDLATLVNENETVYEFIIDSTDPTTNMVDPPSSSVTSSNSTLTFTIKGESSDDNGQSEVLVTIRDAGGDDACQVSDALITEGSGAGEVDTNTHDVTSTANAGDQFEVQFTVNNDAPNTQHLCFFIEASDNAVDVNGDPEPNFTDQSAHTDVTWN